MNVVFFIAYVIIYFYNNLRISLLILGQVYAGL